jgi:hypothetical protein
VTGDTEDPDVEMMTLSVLATEAWLESRGWDAPPIVMVLVDRDGNELAYTAVGEGDPYEILEATDTGDALALLVAAELWAWPPDLPEQEQVGRPSQHPDRVEVRLVVALTRDGTTIGVARPRGGEPDLDTECTGPLVDAMRAAMTGAPR